MAARLASKLAKLNRPRLSGVLARERLFARVDQCLAAPVCWISGPPGAGKTTLAASYLQARDIDGIWYQLDADDADSSNLFYYLAQCAPRKRKPLPSVGPSVDSDAGSFVRHFMREFYARVTQHRVIVFDGYHELGDDAATHLSFREVFAQIPPGLGIIVLSRTSPPAALTKMRAQGDLCVIGWEDLRLQSDESSAIACGVSQFDSRTLENLHTRCDGWAAGLTLMLEQFRGGQVQSVPARADSDVTFDYFAAEIFDQADARMQALWLSTAILPSFTARMAYELTGDEQAQQLLTDLRRRHLFVEQRGASDARFQYHALFRNFLLSRIQSTWSEQARRVHARRAAALLAAEGQAENAIRLHIQAHDWNEAAELIIGHAPRMLAQGRAKTLRDLMQPLPKGQVESSPRLLYALGAAQIASTPRIAGQTLERAYVGFAAQRNDLGQLMVAAAIVESIYFEYANYLGLDRWIDVILQVLKRSPVFPSREIELRVYSCLQIAMTYRCPGHAFFPQCAERITDLIARPLEINQRVVSAGMLLNH